MEVYWHSKNILRNYFCFQLSNPRIVLIKFNNIGISEHYAFQNGLLWEYVLNWCIMHWCVIQWCVTHHVTTARQDFGVSSFHVNRRFPWVRLPLGVGFKRQATTKSNKHYKKVQKIENSRIQEFVLFLNSWIL